MLRGIIAKAFFDPLPSALSKIDAVKRPWRFAVPRSRPHARYQAILTHGESGFTLVEMLVVIAIIGLVMGLVGPRVLSYLGEAKVKAAKIQIESFGSALDLFYMDVGHYPSANEGLTALVERPADAPVWNGPYLKNASVPADPWGHAYLYRVPGERGPYQIVSLGSDGQEGGTGTAADIGSGEKLSAAR